MSVPAAAAPRRASAALVALAWLLLLPAALPAQQARQAPPVPPRFDGWDDLRDPGFVFDPDDRPVYGFSVATSVEARSSYEAARAALSAGAAEAAAEALVELLGRRPNHVLQVGGADGRWVGAGEWARWRLLRDLGDEQRAAAAPEELWAAVEQAAAWREVDRLLQLGRDWEGLPPARDATERAARLLAEEGRREGARAAARRVEELLPPGPGRDDLEALLARLPAPEAPPPEAVRLPPALAPEWESEFTIERLYRWMQTQGLRWLERNGRQPGDNAINPFSYQPPNRYEAPMAPVVPTVADGVVYVSDSLSVTALDLRSGRRLWHHAGPMEAATLERERTGEFDLGIYARSRRSLAISPYQMASPTVAGELVFATVQVPEPWRELRTFEHIPINWPLPRRRLRALDRRTGLEVWRQERPLRGPGDFRNAFDVSGPVAVAGDMVFASGSVTEGAINAYLAAFDRHTGELLWRTLLCSGQQELTMFNRPFKEHVVSPPLLDGWDLYVSTNLGLVACVDAWSGRLRWLKGYPQTPRGSSQSPHRSPLRPVYWTNHPPVLEEGVLFVTPLDSPFGLVLDPSTGREIDVPIPALDRRRDIAGNSLVAGERRHHIVGLGDGRLVVSGPQTVACLDTGTRRVLWSDPVVIERSNEIVGPVTVADGRLLVPLLDELLVLDADTGTPLRRTPWMLNLVRRADAVGPVLLMTDNRRLYAALDIEQELDRASAALGDSPEARLALAELLLNGGRLEDALLRFDEVIEKADARWVERARSGRLETLLRLARRRDASDDWHLALRAAHRQQRLTALAPEAFTALERLGAEDLLDDWLGVLAREHGDAILELGSLTPDGPLPLDLVLSLRALRHDDPGVAVARLAGLILSHPTSPWNGRPLRDVAGERIAALLEVHGRGLYAEFDRRAEEELRAAEDAEALARIEWRYPNALAVSEARRGRLESWLDDGRAREVLEELGRLTTGDRLTGLRARAAEQLGEEDYAAALRGATPERCLPRLPRVPGDGARLTVLDVGNRDRVGFPRLRGRDSLDARRATRALAVVNGRGILFMLDTAATGDDDDPMLWDRRMPGRIAYARPRDVDFIADGDRLLARCGAELAALDIDTGDTQWSLMLSGVPMDVGLTGGLLLVLLEDDGRFRVEGRTPGQGTLALSVELPAGWLVGGMHDVGGLPVLFARTHEGPALVPVDVPGGRLGRVVPMPAGTQSLVLGTPETGIALVMGDQPATRAVAPSHGTWLGGWDVASGVERWRAAARGAYVSRDDLIWSGHGVVHLIETPPTGGLALQRFEVESGPTGGLAFDPGWLPLSSPGQDHAPHVLVAGEPGGGAVVHMTSAAGSGTPGDGSTRSFTLQPAPRGELVALQGRDGYVLVSEEPVPDTRIEVWVVRGGGEPQRYSIDVDLLNVNGRAEAVLVEGAMVLARGGSLAILRADDDTANPPGGER